MKWNPITNQANQEAVDANKMAEAVAKQAEGRIWNGCLLKLALVAIAVTFLFTYRPEEPRRVIPAEKAPSITRDTIPVKHRRTPACVYDPEDPCNKK